MFVLTACQDIARHWSSQETRRDHQPGPHITCIAGHANPRFQFKQERVRNTWDMEHLSTQSRSRHVSFDASNGHGTNIHPRQPPSPVTIGHRTSRRKDSLQHPKPPLTPNTSVPSSMPQAIHNPLLPSAPASPPTPAPSPTPHQRAHMWHHSVEDDEDPILRDARIVFTQLDTTAKERWLASIVDVCDNHLLSFLHHTISPRLKKDPFKVLPNEICFKVGAK